MRSQVLSSPAEKVQNAARRNIAEAERLMRKCRTLARNNPELREMLEALVGAPLREEGAIDAR